MKYENGVRIAETEAVHLVAEHISMICPEVIVLDGLGYIIMTLEHGRAFPCIWYDISKKLLEALIAQLRVDMRRFIALNAISSELSMVAVVMIVYSSGTIKVLRTSMAHLTRSHNSAKALSQL